MKEDTKIEFKQGNDADEFEFIQSFSEIKNPDARRREAFHTPLYNGGMRPEFPGSVFAQGKSEVDHVDYLYYEPAPATELCDNGPHREYKHFKPKPVKYGYEMPRKPGEPEPKKTIPDDADGFERLSALLDGAEEAPAPEETPVVGKPAAEETPPATDKKPDYGDKCLAAHAISMSQVAAERHKLVALFNQDRFSTAVETFGKTRILQCIKNLDSDGVKWITIGCENYPKRLLNLPDPPYVLYCRGNLELLARPCIAIVGTRQCSHYGKDVTEKFAKAFAQSGVVVVSGLAEGIDAAAHRGAGPENTVAVLGNGVNFNYPYCNIALQRDIAAHGLVLSEYLPQTPCTRYTFPHRNRIIAALSKGVLIAESGEKSGTMITKDIALELGLDTFAIPGSILSPSSIGTNLLIKHAHAQIATEPDDVLAIFGTCVKNKSKKNTMTQITFEEKQILDALGFEEAHFDDIVEISGMQVGKLSTLLTNMEVGGLIKKLPGNVFRAVV